MSFFSRIPRSNIRLPFCSKHIVNCPRQVTSAFLTACSNAPNGLSSVESVSRGIATLTVNKTWKKPLGKRRTYELVQPGNISPAQYVPDFIKRPEYADSGIVTQVPLEVEIKNEEQIARTRDSCRLARKILDQVSEYLQVGITTDEIDKITHSLCIENGAYPSPLNYRWYPKSVCTSINNVACHGIPDDRPLKDGDIISIDVSVFYNGYHGDCASTFEIGVVDCEGRNLVKVAKESLKNAIQVCGPGQSFTEIGRVISETVAAGGCSVVPAFCGHGIGSYFHGPPDIFHFDNDIEGIMAEGMTFTIEPVISEGGSEIVVLEDGWTTLTVDNSRTAQFEHTVLITKDGYEILTSKKSAHEI